MIERFRQHVTYAFRLLSRAPLFTATAVLSLAIGIGANATIFTAASALVLAPTRGIADFGRVVDIGRTVDGRGFDTTSYRTFADLQRRTDALSGVYAFRLEPQPMSLGSGTGDGADRIYAEAVSASYFDVLGLVPAAGAFFRTAEEQVGVPLRKAVLSHAFFMRRFNGDRTIVGREIILNGDSFVVAAIAPEGYSGTSILAPDLWVPLTSHARGMPNEELLQSRRSQWLVLGGRLKPGVTIAQAQQSLDAFMAQLTEQYPDVYRRRGLVVKPASRVPGEAGEFVIPFLTVLMALVGLVLLVACTNLAGLMLARSAARSREIAVRLSLGATRGSLIAMLITESLAVFALGTAAALAVAALMTRVLASVVGVLPLPIGIDFAIDWRVLAFTAGLALATGLLTGLVPALQSVRTGLVADLKADANAPRRQRLRHLVVGTQLAFCLILLVMGGLFLRALGTATRIDAGMRIDDVELVNVDLGLGGYTDDRMAAATADISARFASMPGVASVGAARMVPLEGGGLGLGGLRRPGETAPESFIDTDWNTVTPGFLSAIDIGLVRGRQFTDADRSGAPDVAIVNEYLARRVWPNEDPIGKILENGDFRPGSTSPVRRLTIVGVARDSKYRWLGETPRPFIYVPYAQFPQRDVTFFLRRQPGVDDASMYRNVRSAMKSFDADLPVVRMAPLRQSADLGLMPQRIAATVAASLGGVALLLAAIGIYGVTAFAVASRTREIGVRMALGADRRRVVALVLRQAFKLAAIGGAVGLAGAIALASLAADLLFGVSPFDPLTFAATPVLLIVIALAASAVPARRAAGVNPVAALKAE